MQQITIDSTLSQKLGSVNGQVVLCDESGRALGFFSPLPDHPPVEELQLEPRLSRAEVEEMRKNPTGKPLEEILRRLGL
jgi:hypothetical protein